MVLRRSFLIAVAGVLFVVALLLLGLFINYYSYVYVNSEPLAGQPGRFDNYPWLFVLLDASMMTFGAICTLAAVDMLVCTAQKKYSMAMFGIGVALLTLTVVHVILLPFVINFSCYAQYWVTIEDSQGILLAYSLGQVAFLCGFIGLAIAYVLAKKKYLQTDPNE